jgi:hypothetical protein
MTGKTNGTAGANGGIGLQNAITGTLTYYAGGGGGGVYTNGTAGTGGLGGGGAGAAGQGAFAATSGTTNTGGGGGGGPYNGIGGAGGSGIVILRVPSAYSATFSGGLTTSLSTSVTGYKTYTVTNGTGTVTFS